MAKWKCMECGNTWEADGSKDLICAGYIGIIFGQERELILKIES